MPTYATIYHALAEHIAEGRLEGRDVDADALVTFLSETDIGSDADWQKFDAALDSLTERFLQRELA
jgi:hypothetical protein